MKKNIQIVYDKESQVLSIAIGKGRSVDSDIQGNAVLDYDKNGKIIRVNLYDFNLDNFKSGKKIIKSLACRAGASVISK